MKKYFCAWMAMGFLTTAVHAQEIFDALQRNDIPTVRSLIDKSPEVLDSKDNNGLTVLHYAAMGGPVEFIEYLIDKGARLEPPGTSGTPLHHAAMNDRTEAVAALVRRGAPLDTRDSYSRTALILCARERGQAATARVLLDAGARIDAEDKFGDTALDLAVWRGKGEMVDLFLERGAKVPMSGEKWEGGLAMAASKGLTNLFRRLTEGGRRINPGKDSMKTTLHAAARGGSPEIVDTILSWGFDPSGKDVYGWTPLHYAALDGRTETARKLLERGAPMNSRTLAGQTPYNVACERKMEAVAKLLADKGADTGEARFPVLEGDYLGQNPPAGKAEMFSLGIISSIWGNHSTAVFSPDGNEVYWAPMMTFPGEIYSRGGLVMMKRTGGRWSTPEWASFSGPDFDDDVPFFSPDGKRIHFISTRPMPGTEDTAERIWIADRTAAGWSDPRPFDPAINSQQMHWQFSLDRQANVYFASRTPGGFGRDDIYCARLEDGKYVKPVNVGKPVNSDGTETTPFIAPDGSYLLFHRDGKIMVSFPGKDGSWSAPVNLGGLDGICPMVTADGKYLFFNKEGRVYWMASDVIEKARPK